MRVDACHCLSDPLGFFAGDIAALTVRLRQDVVSGKSVSHRQASFSLLWPCSRMQQAFCLLFLSLTGFPVDSSRFSDGF